MNSPDPNLLYDKFAVLECLKKDAHSAVYLADHAYLGKKIILKTLNTENLPDRTILQRFQREARILAQLDHPNIIKVLDFGAQGRDFYISFEYFPGSNLREALQKGELNAAQKLELAKQLFQGLAVAHQSGVIHRDLKPENILINASRRLKIADFGLAQAAGEEQLTQKSSIVGTPAYMSPEQIRGEKLTPQSDLFSAGVVVFELFGGGNPFLGNDVAETINNILKAEPLKLVEQYFPAAPREGGDLAGGIPALLQALLQKDRRRRPASAEEALKRLAGISPAHGFHIEDSSPLPTALPTKDVSILETHRDEILPDFTASLPTRPLHRRWLIPLLAALLIAGGFVFLRPQKSPETTGGGSFAPADSAAVSGAGNAIESLPAVIQRPAARQPGEENPPRRQTGGRPPEQASPPTGENPASTGETESLLPASLRIECLPWADIYIDERKVDTTPLENPISLPPGNHTVRLIHPRYPAYVRNVSLQPGQDMAVSVNLDTLWGYLDCRVHPWGEIYIDGQAMGQTPLGNPLALHPGQHTLTVVNPQYSRFDAAIFITRRDTLRWQLNLETGNDKSPGGL